MSSEHHHPRHAGILPAYLKLLEDKAAEHWSQADPRHLKSFLTDEIHRTGACVLSYSQYKALKRPFFDDDICWCEVISDFYMTYGCPYVDEIPQVVDASVWLRGYSDFLAEYGGSDPTYELFTKTGESPSKSEAVGGDEALGVFRRWSSSGKRWVSEDRRVLHALETEFRKVNWMTERPSYSIEKLMNDLDQRGLPRKILGAQESQNSANKIRSTLLTLGSDKT